MKTKIQVLAMMFIAAMAFGACDDDDKNDNIKAPDAVSKALKDKYPAAMDIEWERKGDYFVADCWMDGREMDGCSGNLEIDGDRYSLGRFAAYGTDRFRRRRICAVETGRY